VIDLARLAADADAAKEAILDCAMRPVTGLPDWFFGPRGTAPIHAATVTLHWGTLIAFHAAGWFPEWMQRDLIVVGIHTPADGRAPQWGVGFVDFP